MSGWPDRPVIHQINTAVWLDSLSRQERRVVTLGDVPESTWDALCGPGLDAVWLMGVWERSPLGLELSGRPIGPGAVGSPYCVRRYVVDAAFGGPDGLAAARETLARRGVKLVLDHVPNHVAPDHPWVAERPELFVRGTPADLAEAPSEWLETPGGVLARGRDPYFPPWPDVVQLDAFSPDLRAATAETLTTIADQCDGIRCDMAMLPTNGVFARTWHGRTGPAPAAEFWPSILDTVRARQPGTVFIAEAYWDMEWTLQHQGFDFCYDKRLYDRLIGLNPGAVRDHLDADPDYQARLLRFLENHDEPRAASRLPVDAERAAAVVVATLPGATLWHEGQYEGRRAQAPLFDRRLPDEQVDVGLAAWHRALRAIAAQVRTGTWEQLEPECWPDNHSGRELLAWTWSPPVGDRHLVVVNLSPGPAQARLRLPWRHLAGRTHRLADLLSGTAFDREGDELAEQGLYVALEPWGHHVFAITG
ncbi:hypothetical protein GCM10022243_34620 [Saccharothrix violaceirubra]|uniref:Glycosyl hydrolase family 13 catalytic domain-containing protein n=1 Tax=Saccharothrix violaceirubra TaxID=413306 RepID=A0A7W7WXE0_9PSEU|nr:alpha-amylase family glycosyl hydrolase [Saccharothrix violaceirubra]MBB4966513.1 hypothetical protein [Saccharothrix violaceirubra]